MRPIPLRCARCWKLLGATEEHHELGFDARMHELCAECWQALVSWIGANDRIREIGGAAA